jgi:pyruvate oxidase
MNVAEWVTEQLVAWGVNTVYGVPGDAILPLLDAFNKHPVLNFISVKHEAAGALMASAEAKLMDRIGVCVGTSGPGTVNLMNGLADAKSDRVPVLAITSQVDSFNLGTEYKQYIDQSMLMAAVTDYNGLVAAPDSCNDVLTSALRATVSGGNVAHVAFTKDIWEMPVEEGIRTPEPYLGTKAQSAPEVIAEAVRRLNEAQRPAILAGRGIKYSGDLLIKLAEKWQSGICVTMPAKGMLSGTHPLVMGGLGEGGSEASTAMLAEADLILIIGATWWPEQYVPALTRVIQIDAVPENIGRRMPVEYGVVGELSVLLPQIIAGISSRNNSLWVERLAKLRDEWQSRLAPEIQADGYPVAPGYLIKTLEKTIAGDAIVAVDVGDHAVWFNRIFAGERQDILISGSWRTMGFGLPAAISAKLANPDRQVIALVGDGCMAQSLGEFLTAVRYRLPITVVVVNNGYLAMEKGKMEVKSLDPEITTVTNPDFADFAAACGGAGFRVAQSGELAPVLEQAIHSGQPAIVDVMTSPVVFPGILH